MLHSINNRQIVCNANSQSADEAAKHSAIISKTSNRNKLDRNLSNSPTYETPPFVPRGTLFRVVIRNGSPDPSTVPNSLAHVSPLQQANEPDSERKEAIRLSALLCPFLNSYSWFRCPTNYFDIVSRNRWPVRRSHNLTCRTMQVEQRSQHCIRLESSSVYLHLER